MATRQDGTGCAERCGDGGARTVERGSQAEENACGERDAEDESKDRQIGGDVEDEGSVFIGESICNPDDGPLQEGPAEEKREPAGKDSQQRALGEQLAHQAATTGAEREAHGELVMPGGSACQLEARHVGAGHDQHQGDGQHDEQEGKHQAGVLAEGNRKRRARPHRGVEALGPVRPGIVQRAETIGEEGHLGLRLAHGDAGRQTSAEMATGLLAVGEPVFLRVHEWLKAQREPEIRSGDKGPDEVAGRDADDGERRSIQKHFFADDCGVAVEFFLPVVSADEDGRG